MIGGRWMLNNKNALCNILENLINCADIEN